jgi:STE24 endopeptidase
MTTFTWVFLALLSLWFALRLWLAASQVAYVRRHRATVPVEFTSLITLEDHQKAANYTVAKTRLGMIESGFDALFLLMLTLGGLIAAVDALSAQWLGAGYWRGVVTVLGVMVISTLVSLPFDICRTFVIEERFGFNRITWPLFVVDMVKSALLMAALSIPLLLVTFWLLERAGQYWWLYLWLVWLAFATSMQAIFPTFIAPLFNKFTPLKDDVLKARIENLLSTCGFRAKGVFVMDGSKRSGHGNAYFAGLSKTKRVVFFDTLLERLNADEIEAVLAHELGHYKRKHIPKRIVSSFAIAFVILALMGWVIDKPWFYQGLGLQGVPHVGVQLLLFFTLLPVFTFPFTPLGSYVSRQQEFEADAFAAEQTRATVLINALVKLFRDNAATLTPHPLHSMIYDSHPPAAIRIAHLKALKPA